MAEPVIVPVQAKVIDVDTSEMNFKDVSAEISKSMTGIKKSIQDAFKGIDPSAINKPIEQAMTSVKKSVQAAEDAQIRYNEALIRAGKSTEEYKSAISSANSAVSDQQALVNELSKLGPAAAPFLNDAKTKLNELIEARNKINPLDFVDNAEPIQLEKIANAYKKVLSAQENVNTQSKNFNKVAHDNRFSDEYTKMAKEAESYGKKLSALDEKFKNMQRQGATANQWQTARNQAESYTRKLEEVITKMRAAVNAGSAFRFGDGNKDEANAQINRLASAGGGNVGSQVALGKATRIANLIKSGFGKALSVVGKVSSALGGVAKRVVGCIKNMNLFGKAGHRTSTDLQSRFKKLGKNILMFGLGFRTMYFAVKRLRNIFIEGFKLMGDEFDEFGKPMKTMMESFNRLKGSLATAFQPIASVVIPILTKAMNYLSGMLETIGKFTATLTGQGYIYKAIAKNINSVAGAAKNANNQLGSYDKLEVINDHNTGYDYEKQTIGETDRAVSSFAQMVKDAWEKANFKGVGEYVTEQLLNVLDIVEKNIIPRVTSFVNRVLRSVNTFFDGFDSKAIGAKLGSIVNTIVNGLDWSQLGMMFANLHNVVWEFVDGIVNKIDWVALGKALSTGVNSLFTSLNIESFVGAISGLSKGIVNLFITAITLIDWKGIANTLLSAIQTLLQNVGNDMVNTNNPIVSAFGEVVLAIGETIDKLRPAVEAIIASVSPLIQSILPIFSELLPPIAEIISGIVVTILPPLVKLISVLLPPLIRLVDALLPILRDFLVRISNEIANLAEFLSDVVVPIFDVLVGVVELVTGTVGVLFRALRGEFGSVKDIFNELLKAWKKPINNIIGAVESLVNNVISGFNSMINSLNKIQISIPDWVPKYGGQSFGINLPKLNSVKIPRLAQGAVIPPNQEFLAMLGDQKHGTNIEAPLDTIKQALAEVLAEVGGGNREPIVLQVNGRTLAKVVWDEQEKRYKQTGKYSPA